MATGFVQRWKGKLKADTIYLGSGGIVSGASGIGGKVEYVKEISLPVTAVTNTDFTMSIPPGATFMAAKVFTTTAYTGTTGDISIGSAAAGAQYVAATDIKAVGVVSLVLVNAAAAALLSIPNASPNIFIRIAQSTTPTAVGAGKLQVVYNI